MFHTVVHDGQGTWFSPAVMQVSTLNQDQFDRLEAGEESVLTDSPEIGPDKLLEPADLNTLIRVLGAWLPEGTIDSDRDGQVIIYTGLNATDDSEGS